MGIDRGTGMAPWIVICYRIFIVIAALAVCSTFHLWLEKQTSIVVLILRHLCTQACESMFNYLSRTLHGGSGREHGFVIGWNPLVPWLVALAILPQVRRSLRLLATAAVPFVVVSVLTATDAVVSIHSSETGAPWRYAHNPCHVLAYLLTMLLATTCVEWPWNRTGHGFSRAAGFK